MKLRFGVKQLDSIRFSKRLSLVILRKNKHHFILFKKRIPHTCSTVFKLAEYVNILITSKLFHYSTKQEFIVVCLAILSELNKMNFEFKDSV